MVLIYNLDILIRLHSLIGLFKFIDEFSEKGKMMSAYTGIILNK